MLNLKCWKQPILTGLDEFFGNDHICNILFRELIYRATREDKTWTDKRGKTTQLKRGQVVFGRNIYAMHLGGHDDMKIERALKKLEKVYKLVSKQADKNFTIVELLNYEELIHFEQANEQAMSKQRASSEQAVSTYKEIKNIETDKKEEEIHTAIFNYWNQQNIVQHSVFTSDMAKQIRKRLKDYSEVDLKLAIERYSEIYRYIPLAGEKKLGGFKWTLAQFMQREAGMPAYLTKELKDCIVPDYNYKPNAPSALDLRIKSFIANTGRQPNEQEIQIFKQQLNS